MSATMSTHKCRVCSRELASNSNLKRHYMSHTGERPFTCETCDLTFSHKSTLHNHQMIHSDSRPHACAVCGKSFRQRAHLFAHQMTHSGNKPFSCSICNYRCNRKCNLLRHMKLHCSIKLYWCGCNRSFDDAKSYRHHQAGCPSKSVPKSSEDASDDSFECALEESSSDLVDDPVEILAADTTLNDSGVAVDRENVVDFSKSEAAFIPVSDVEHVEGSAVPSVEPGASRTVCAKSQKKSAKRKPTASVSSYGDSAAKPLTSPVSVSAQSNFEKVHTMSLRSNKSRR